MQSLKKTLNKCAKTTGFIKRQKDLTAKDFFILMTIGSLGMKHPSLAAMVDSINARISREALHQRFTESAVRFMENCTRFILKQKINQSVHIETNLLEHYNRIQIADSSSWDVNPKLQGILPGSGGSASSSNCKLQVFYEYKYGELSFFEITPGIRPDNGYSPNLPGLLQSNDLLIADLGYFRLKTFYDIDQKGAFFLSRLLVGTTLLNVENETPIDLSMLKGLSGNAYEIPVIMGKRKDSKVSCRLICLKLSEQAANERRRRLKKEAKRKGRTPKKFNLMLCDWALMVTNVPEAWLPAENVRSLYSLRWQIELLFKQFKSILCIHLSNTGNVNRLKCEILGKLIMAIFIHRIHASINVHLWNTQHKELSMDKLYKRIQERAFTILNYMIVSIRKALKYLSKEIPRLIKNCMKFHQLSRKTSLEVLEYGIIQKIVVRKIKCLT
ncbi:MAG: IS4 family transposase [Bacteroidetes bacterium]|nr:IS4 family transposase [Bacteroidota bacterium]